MNFKKYFYGLTLEQRELYADRVPTSVGYIQSHLLPRGKIPRKETMEKLADATNGKVTYEEMVAYFFETSAA